MIGSSRICRTGCWPFRESWRRPASEHLSAANNCALGCQLATALAQAEAELAALGGSKGSSKRMLAGVGIVVATFVVALGLGGVLTFGTWGRLRNGEPLVAAGTGQPTVVLGLVNPRPSAVPATPTADAPEPTLAAAPTEVGLAAIASENAAPVLLLPTARGPAGPPAVERPPGR